jgi:signal transduction histidine kinase
MNQLIITRGFLGQGNGAIIALIFTLVAGLFPPSELPPNRMWAIFQPKGDREGHDRRHALPQAQAGGNMQIHDKRLTHRFDGRVTLFDSVGIGELRSEPVPPHCEATRTMSASVGVAGAAAAQMAREPDASVAAPNEERLAERTRIAQDLHDTLLQGFFAVSMQLRAALNTLPEDCAERPRLSTVMQLLDRVLEEGRYFLEGLRSPNERKTSLGKAFARVPNDLGLSSVVGFRVIVLGTERELSVSLCDDIYRIVREAIVNAYRHSGAKDIETEIEYRASDLRFAVRDNGCGIDPQDLQWGKNGHWGLQGMRERADRIGGRLRVLSRSELGTEIELRVPC